MHLIDWLIMSLPLLICGCIAVYTQRYVRSVADFMAGGRNAGRFLICTARSEQGSGAAVFVAGFQVFLVAGFTLSWWSQLSVPISLLVMITGFVIYRFRQTRAMTLGQFFEMRYTRNFRLFAGALGFLAGLINFGIIPAVGSRFMVAFLGWPQTVHLLGMEVPTFLLLMSLFLTLTVIMTTTAGQVSVLLTDCAEGMFSQIFYTIIAIVLLVCVFNWADTKAALLNTEPGKSLVNPFDSMGLKDFNIWYVLIGIFGGTYRCIAWQNSHAFNSSAATPHEARMGSILGRWRGFAAGVMVTLLSACALTYFKTHTAAIDAALSKIQDPAVRDQMRAPIALTMMLPVGVKGMLLSICLMGIIAGDGIHLHSWGSIFIQDVVAPLRQRPSRKQTYITFAVMEFLWCVIAGLLYAFVLRPAHPGLAANTPLMLGLGVLWGGVGAAGLIPFGKLISSSEPLTPRQHIFLLRMAIVGVACWAFLFGWLVPQIKYVQYWWGITEAIFVSGAGVAIIGGLYWSRGTTTGAWIALIVGSVLACCGIGAQFYHERVLNTDFIMTLPWIDWSFRVNIPLITFTVSMTAIACYVISSLLVGRDRHNMDRLLHRGAYAVEPESAVVAARRADAKAAAILKPPNWFFRIITFGIDEHFSRSDRWITIGITLWSMTWFTMFVVGSIVYFVHPWSNAVWANYWFVVSICLPLVIGFVTTIWFTWGCTRDMRVFFRRLREEKVNTHDDGTVAHGENAEDTTAPGESLEQGGAAAEETDGKQR